MTDAFSRQKGSMLKRAAGVLLAGLALTACGMEREPNPTNKVVVILDRTGTYKHRLEAAIGRVRALLESLSKTKLKRWESDVDQIVLISLDALPEVLWTGNLRQLKALDQAAWTSRLQGRSDYTRCTDVEAAFRLAGQHLQSEKSMVHKYLFVFSDLIHEPPTASLGTCQAPTTPSVPSEAFPWEALGDVQTKVFWVPPDQKLAWSRAVAEQGLQETFTLYTTSESATVTLETPERAKDAKDTRTEAEQEAARVAQRGVIWTWLWRASAIVMAIAGVVVGGFVLLGRRGGQPPQRPAAAPRRRSVPPLPTSALRRPAHAIPGGPQGRGPRPPFSTQSAPHGGERSSSNGHDGL